MCLVLILIHGKTGNLAECVSECVIVFVCVYNLNLRPSPSLPLHHLHPCNLRCVTFGKCRDLGRDKTWKIFTTILSVLRMCVLGCAQEVCSSCCVFGRGFSYQLKMTEASAINYNFLAFRVGKIITGRQTSNC